MADNRNKQRRNVALVIVGAALLAVFAPVIARDAGLGIRFEILLYLFSLAAFFWALVVTWQIWQKRDK